MATKSVQASSKAGAAPTFDAANASDKFLNSGREVLHVKNAHGSISTTVTIHSQKLCSLGSTHNLTVTVPFGTEKRIGPFETDRFNDTDGYVIADFSSQASVTVGVFKG